jgi:hypothetical protein
MGADQSRIDAGQSRIDAGQSKTKARAQARLPAHRLRR